MLAVLLAGIHDSLAISRRGWFSRELLGTGEEVAPLRKEEVHDVQVLRRRFGDSALGGEEVDVRVAAEVALAVKVLIPLDPKGQLPLSRLDLDFRAQRLVFVTARDVHDQFAARQPALALAVDVCVADLAEPYVPADIDMPGSQVRENVRVVAVRRVWDSARIAKVDAAGDRFAG